MKTAIRQFAFRALSGFGVHFVYDRIDLGVVRFDARDDFVHQFEGCYLFLAYKFGETQTIVLVKLAKRTHTRNLQTRSVWCEKRNGH